MLRRIAAEGLGSVLLAATVIGSGIMAGRLATGNLAVALAQLLGALASVPAAHLLFAKTKPQSAPEPS